MRRNFHFAVVLGLLTAPVAADDRPIQCFGRGYDEAELRANQEQIVEAIIVMLREPADVSEEQRNSTYCDVPEGEADAILWVLFADQGFARETNLGGVLLGQTAKCSMAEGDASICGDKYSTGEILLEPQADGTLNATTENFRMPWIAECGGVINIATNNETTIFRLEKQDDAVCLRMLENAP